MFHKFAIWFSPYTQWISHTIASHSALAPLLLLFIEEAGIPLFIPGDLVLAYTGYQVSVTNAAPWWMVFIVALAAVIGGATVLFFISRRWGNIVIDKLGKFIFLRESDIKKAEKLFKKYGVWTIIVGRHIPGLRIPLTIFAGASGMSYRAFILSTLASTALWVLLALHVGRHFGADIEHLVRKHIGISIAVVALAVIVIVALHIVGSHERKEKSNR
ncbi:MAG TPA: DedA family protein [Candidatus Saccharimonas sp.]|nr:DedA family protein [Candidatus Saccharimonas sp.]